MPVTIEQKAVCARFESEIVPAASELKLGIALATLRALPIYATRLRQEHGTCGWYIHGGEYSENPDFFQPLHVAHIAEYCPQIVPYLALAPGWRVIIAPDYEDVWFDEQMLQR